MIIAMIIITFMITFVIKDTANNHNSIDNNNILTKIMHGKVYDAFITISYNPNPNHVL